MWNSNILDKTETKLPSALVDSYRIIAVENMIYSEFFNNSFENSFWFSKVLKDNELLELLSFSSDENVVRIKNAIINAFIYGGTYQSIFNILYAVFTPELNIEVLNLDGTNDTDGNPFYERGDIRINISNTGKNASTGITTTKYEYDSLLDSNSILDSTGVFDPLETEVITGIIVKNGDSISGILANKFTALGGLSVEDFIKKFIPVGCRFILNEV